MKNNLSVTGLHPDHEAIRIAIVANRIMDGLLAAVLCGGAGLVLEILLSSGRA